MTPMPCIEPDPAKGDCWRACFASILDIPTSDVPNFGHSGGDWKGMLALAREWLAPQGLAIFETYISAEWGMDKALDAFSARNPNAPFIMCGQSGGVPGMNHAVVVLNGAIVHDPSGCGVDGPCVHDSGSGWWWFHVICVAAARDPQGER